MIKRLSIYFKIMIRYLHDFVLKKTVKCMLDNLKIDHNLTNCKSFPYKFSRLWKKVILALFIIVIYIIL